MFTKYLPQNGIKPIVITLDPKTQTEYKIDSNNYLIESLNQDKTIYPIKIKKPKTSLFYKFKQIYLSVGDDKYKRWHKEVENNIDSILKNHNVKCIYLTAPPFSNGKLAVSLSKKYNLPLILDMRDGWSKWCIAPYASFIHYLATKQTERYYFESATKVVTVTNSLKKVFIETHPNIPRNKFEVIPNGFDLKNDEIPSHLSSMVSNSDFIKIGYIGTFYYNPKSEKSLTSSWWQKKPHRWFQYFPVNEKWIYRSPYFFLKSLSALLMKKPELKSKVKFVFIGNAEDWLIKMINDLGLTENFENRGFIQHSELEKNTSDLNYFLSTSVKVEDGEDYALASKTFDYIKFAKPILGFVTNGAQKEFLEKSNTGIILNPDEIEKNALQLEKIFNSETELNVNIDYLNQFSRAFTTNQLSNLIKQILNEKN